MAPKGGPGSNTKGGGPRGGPKRWTGGGPRPARHIPWPEIFKHHISVVEGHLKMLEMIKKHTMPDTGNWRSICLMVDRSYDLLRMAKDATRSFVPPSSQREQVPIGSSSASMYPGYSPADHEYGKAASEYGIAVAAARAEGVDFKPGQDPNGPEYVIGQAKGEKRKTLAQIKAEKLGANGNGSGSGSDTQNAGEPSKNRSMDGNAQDVRRSSEPASGDNPYFVIDTNPTPVHIPGMPNGHTKRSSTDRALSEPTEEKKSKKVKTKHTVSGEETKVELEDISEEVDARLKEKEDKRKRKEEKKKRKRELEGSSGVAAESSDGLGESGTSGRKKAKREKVGGDADAGEKVEKKKKKRHSSAGEGAAADEGRNKKRRASNSGVGAL